MNLFKKKNYIRIQFPQNAESNGDEPKIPDGSWIKCSHCGKPIYRKELDEFKICPNCGGHFRIGARERTVSYTQLSAERETLRLMFLTDLKSLTILIYIWTVRSFLTLRQDRFPKV